MIATAQTQAMADVVVRELPWRDPLEAARLVADLWGRDGLVLLDGTAEQDETARWAYLGCRAIVEVQTSAWPEALTSTNTKGRETQDPFSCLKAAQAAIAPLAMDGPAPFNGGWMGWMSYEAGAWVEERPGWCRPDQPLLWAAVHDPLLVFDLRGRCIWLISRGLTSLSGGLRGDGAVSMQTDRGGATGLAERLIHRWHQSDSGEGTRTEPRSIPPPASPWRWHTTPHEFRTRVNQVKRWISAGDLFQANLTACCETILEAPPDPLELYARLVGNSPAPFSGLLIQGANAIVSSSPERFLSVDGNGRVETRPIKGTRPRDGDPQRDADLAADLVCSEKDRAENLMIVDLLRNDLGRCCIPGSIEVHTLAGLESYPAVHHLTSVVRGQLRPDVKGFDLMRLSWPGGSVTGAPKVRACRRLAGLEPIPRGPYCGSLFWLDGNGGMDSSIIIRSLIQRGRRLRAHAGCGIVADSDSGEETREMEVKIQPQLDVVQPA